MSILTTIISDNSFLFAPVGPGGALRDPGTSSIAPALKGRPTVSRRFAPASSQKGRFCPGPLPCTTSKT